jgi:hypothetical protein
MIRRTFLFLLLAAALIAQAVFAQKEPKPAIGEAPVQPLPFSHRTHTSTGMKCVECHQTVATATSAGMPSVDFCMRCHIAVKKESPAVAKLAQHQKDHTAVEWTPVYRLPGFVYFSHRRHFTRAGIPCGTCHGDVAAQNVLSKEKSISMSACQACHDTRKANNSCDACHVPHPG